MGELLRQAASPESLNRAWKKPRPDKTVWAPGLSRAEMEKDLVLHITRLAKELASGRYRPAQVRHFPVLKGDGKRRVISALTLRDKLAQRAVLSVLTPMGESLFHQDSYGYRPGRSIPMALERVKQQLDCGLFWLVDADIKSFFDTIPHSPLKKIIKKTVSDRNLARLIFQWLETGAPRTGILARRRGIPQGGVISPFLCNLYLTEFDRFLDKSNLPFVRFADDFLVFTPSKAHARAAKSRVEKGLSKLGLTLHPDKTRITPAGPWVTFLGQKLPGKYKGKQR